MQSMLQSFLRAGSKALKGSTGSSKSLHLPKLHQFQMASQIASSSSHQQADLQFKDSEVLLATTFDSKNKWAEYLRSHGLKVQVHPESITDLSKIEFAICWNPPAGLLQQCPNLKAIQSMGAGVDSLVKDPTLPRHLPLIRVIDPLMTERMATWVLWAVINIQRKCEAYRAAQLEKRWDKGIENYRNIDNSELRVGVMGLGVMGGATADMLRMLGYDVSAWTRREKQKQGIKCFHGQEQLKEFAGQADIIVCLLPLTPATRGILNAQLFEWMGQGSSIINAARGGHLVESDLLHALNIGKLSSAVLDVFDPEPLPPESLLWEHPNIRIFPHVSSMTNVESAVEQMLQNREVVLKGLPPPAEFLVDWHAGY